MTSVVSPPARSENWTASIPIARMDQHPMAASDQDPRRCKPDAVGGTGNADDGHSRHHLPLLPPPDE